MFRCSTCDFVTEVKRSLGRHNLLIHSDANPFSCHVCKASFKNKRHFNSHLTTHTQKKRHPCFHEGCEYSSDSLNVLKVHTRSHTGEKPYKCTFLPCNYSSATRGALKTHVYSHTGERPFPCSFPGCQYSSRASGTLKLHFRTHTGSKPFRCTFNFCQHSCRTPSDLKVHTLGHLTRNPNKCPLCHFRFETRIDVECHLSLVHEHYEGLSENAEDSIVPVEIIPQARAATLQFQPILSSRSNVVESLSRVEGDGSGKKGSSPPRILILPAIKVSHQDEADDRAEESLLKSRGFYLCVICDERIKRKQEFEAHLKWHWDEGRSSTLPNDTEPEPTPTSESEPTIIQKTTKHFCMCFGCNFSTTKLMKFKAHTYRHCDTDRFFCSVCDFVCRELERLEAHELVAHADEDATLD